MTEAAAAEHAEPALRLRGVGRRFGGLHAVRDVELEIVPGERRAILGPNGGLSVEDNIYLAVVGVTGGHLRPVVSRRDTEMRERARAAARRVAIDHKLPDLVRNLSHGEHRQVGLTVALAAKPRMMMLDEPASGLSRGERQLLTDLLLLVLMRFLNRWMP